MKRCSLAFFCLLSISLFAGCFSLPKTADLDVSDFVGTKWVQLISFMGERNTLEFIDETTLVHTFYGELKTKTYKIIGNKIKFGGDTYTFGKAGEKITFENTTGYLKNDTLLLRGNPYWAKEER